MGIILGVVAPTPAKSDGAAPMTDGMPKGVGHIPQDHGQTFSPLFGR